MSGSPRPMGLTEITLHDINRDCNDLKNLSISTIERLESERPEMKLAELAAMFEYRVKEVMLEQRTEPLDPIKFGDYYCSPTDFGWNGIYQFNIRESCEIDGIRYLGNRLVEYRGPITTSGYGNNGRIFVFESIHGPTPNPDQYTKRKMRDGQWR